MANERVSALGTQVYKPDITDFGDRDSNSLGSRKISPFDEHGYFRNAFITRGVSFNRVATSRVVAALTNQPITTEDFSLSVMVRVPTANQSARIGFLGLSGANSGSGSGSIYCAFESSSASLFFQLDGGGSYYQGSVTNVITNWGGTWINLVVARAAGVLTIYINGIAATLSSQSGSTYTDWSATISSTYLIVGQLNGCSSNSLETTVYNAVFYNFALSASDAAVVYMLGGGVPHYYQWGTQVSTIPTGDAVTNGASDANSNTAMNGLAAGSGGVGTTPTAGTRTGGAGSWFMRLNTSTGNGFTVFGLQLPSTYKHLLRKARVSGWSKNNSGTANCFISNAIGSASGGIQLPTGSSWAAFTGDITYGGGNAGIAFSFGSGVGGEQYDIDDLIVKPLGAVCWLPLDDGLGYQLQDLSVNRLHGLMTTTGIEHACPSFGPARLRLVTDGTTSAQQLGGQSTLPANIQILRVRARSTSGTPNLILGTSSGGSQIVASVALSTTWKDLTIALTGGVISTLSDLWATASTGNPVQVDITWEPLSN